MDGGMVYDCEFAENTYLSFLEREFDKDWDTSLEREEGAGLFGSPDSGLGPASPQQRSSESMELSPVMIGHSLTDDDFLVALDPIPIRFPDESLTALSPESPQTPKSDLDSDDALFSPPSPDSRDALVAVNTLVTMDDPDAEDAVRAEVATDALLSAPVIQTNSLVDHMMYTTPRATRATKRPLSGSSDATYITTRATRAEKRPLSCFSESSDEYYPTAQAASKKKKYEAVPSSDPVEEKSRRNAIVAKQNREKKKRLMSDLETKVTELTTENATLIDENTAFKTRHQELEQEIRYLKSVIANSSGLGQVLQQLSGLKDVRLTTSFGNAADMLGGVCIHVDGNRASVEFCAECSRKAGLVV